MSDRGMNAWYHREAFDEATGTWRVACYLGDRFPDGEVAPIEDPDDLAGAIRIWQASTDDDGHLSIAIDEHAAPKAPEVWYVVLDQFREDPPAFDLVAFASDHVPFDRVIDDPTFTMLPVRASEQLGAIRWWPSTAVVDQVYVSQAHRRSQMATKLVYAASAYHQHRGWPGRLHSDGRRTHLGDRFTAGLRHPGRIAPWTGVSRPMDPED